MEDYKMQLAAVLAKITGISAVEAEELIEVPSNRDMGDFAFPCFRFAKILKKSPNVIASELTEKIVKPQFIERVENVNAYINFYVDKTVVVQAVLDKVLAEKDGYGFAAKKDKGNIVIDYSSPNIAKPFHIGHLRSTVIGNSLYRIFEALGYNCIGINHLGDWGTQFGKLIVAYEKYSTKEDVEQKGIQELLRIYVKFHDEAKSDPSLEDLARENFTKMEQGDANALALWRWFKEISLKEFERVYKMLDISFDSLNGEAFYNDKMDKVIKELDDKKLTKISEGAKIIELDNMSPCLITKKDGSSLYATRDITAALYRKETYDFKKCIYVTALAQNLHFSQFFKVIEKMGYAWSVDLVHVPFGMVSMETGSLSTRSGNVLLLEEILAEAVKKTKEIIEEKNPNLENKEEVAQDVGIGAIIFDDMYNTIIKDIQFSWEKVLNFDGETGPYVQYTYARANSVLRKSGMAISDIENICVDLIIDEQSVALVKQIGAFNSMITEAAEKYEPSVIARYAVNLAKCFNKFYHDNSILVDDMKLKKARLALVVSTMYTIKNALWLLGIKAPKQM
ncbi:arginine--tRNA ligase [Candidatus Epulonipiscium viviparus]|uniref:arginine--tRNA ligase n=1 Tax=Candidatus Epulonipiscium viviparus TaxID=420336 RepID=UPI0027381111|nr:arginine--tRNA ligase [Candidatus Epulopiscium viviparus]